MWDGDMGPFLTSLGTYLGQKWSKIWLFCGSNQASLVGWFQGEDPAWKVFYVPYHTPQCMGQLVLGPSKPFPVTYLGQRGSENAYIWVKK